MPCYHSLAADRHADEQGQLHRLDILTEQTQADLLDRFDEGETSDFLDFDDVMDEVACDARFYQLIEHAWRSGEYRQLGDEIRTALHDTAEQQLRQRKPDIEDFLRECTDTGDG